MKLKIISKLETSDHDGYCSGGECEYECKIVENIVDVPEKYKSNPKGILYKYDECDNIQDNDNDNEYDWEKLLPKPEINDSGSYYCKLSRKSRYCCHSLFLFQMVLRGRKRELDAGDLVPC